MNPDEQTPVAPQEVPVEAPVETPVDPTPVNVPVAPSNDPIIPNEVARAQNGSVVLTPFRNQ